MAAPQIPNALYGAVNSTYGNIILAQTLFTPFRYGAWQTKSGWPEDEYRERFRESPSAAQNSLASIAPTSFGDTAANRNSAAISQIYRKIEASDAMEIMNLRVQAHSSERESRGQRKKRHDDDNEAFSLLMN